MTDLLLCSLNFVMTFMKNVWQLLWRTFWCVIWCYLAIWMWHLAWQRWISDISDALQAFFHLETFIFLWFSYGFPMVFPFKPRSIGFGSGTSGRGLWDQLRGCFWVLWGGGIPPHPTVPRSLVFLVFQSDPATTKASDSSDDLDDWYL